MHSRPKSALLGTYGEDSLALMYGGADIYKMKTRYLKELILRNTRHLVHSLAADDGTCILIEQW